MWEIFAIGDAVLVGGVLNALGMLANANIFLQLAAIGLLLGVLSTVAKGLSEEGRINPGPIFGSAIIILLMFSQTTTVSVVNLRTGSSQVISNVPLGPAALGSMVSRMGKAITEVIELSFSTPEMTDYGFVTPVKALANVRRIPADSAVISLVDDPENNGSSISKTVRDYVQHCTYRKIQNNETSVEKIFRSPDPIGELESDHTSISTLQYLDGPYPVSRTCKDGYTKMVTALNGPYKTKLVNAAMLLTAQTVTEHNAASPPSDYVLSYATAQIESTALTAGQLALSSAVNRMFEIGILDQYENDRLWTKTVTAQDAINARIESWQAESTVFEHFMLPIISLLEALVFAITPFAALAIGLGAKGIKVAGTYMVLAIWVQLWVPILAVINWFIIEICMASLRNVGAGIDPSATFPSWSALNAIDSPLQTWLAVAGWMASSVPFISAAILFGGGQLIGKLGSMASGSGAASGHSSTATPSIHQSAPVVKGQGSTYASYDIASGVSRAGASQMAPSYSLGVRAAETRKAAEQNLRTAQSTVQEKASEILGSERGSQELYKTMSGMSLSEIRSSGRLGALSAKVAEQLQESGQYQHYATNELAAKIGASIKTDKGFFGKIAKALTGLQVGASVSASGSDGSRKTEAISDTHATENASTNQLKQEFNRALKADASSENSNAVQQTLKRVGGQEYSAARSDVIAASNNLETAQTIESAIQGGLQFDEVQYTNKVLANADSNGGRAGFMQNLRETNQKYGISNDVENLRNQLIQPGGLYLNTEEGRARAEIAATSRIMSGLSQSRNLDESERTAGQAEFFRNIADAYGVSVSGGSNIPTSIEQADAQPLIKEHASMATNAYRKAHNAADGAVEDVAGTNFSIPSGPDEGFVRDNASLVNNLVASNHDLGSGDNSVALPDDKQVNGPSDKDLGERSENAEQMTDKVNSSVGLRANAKKLFDSF